MAMKPIPKLILIVAVVGGLGYVVNQFVTLPKAPPAAVDVPTPTVAPTPVPPQPIQPTPSLVAAPPSDPTPDPATRPTQDPSVDRGLNNLLRTR
jgi:hypothetical protein